MEISASAYHGLLWGVRRSIRYHERRRSVFERFNLATNAVALIFGSATILAVFAEVAKLADSKWWTISPAAFVTLMSSLNLVIGTVQKAQRHHDLARRFIELEQELVQSDPSDLQSVRRLQAKRLEIEADEPPILQIVDILSHNELMRAGGYDPESYPKDYYKVGFWRTLFSPCFDLFPNSVKKIDQPKPLAGSVS